MRLNTTALAHHRVPTEACMAHASPHSQGERDVQIQLERSIIGKVAAAGAANNLSEVEQRLKHEPAHSNGPARAHDVPAEMDADRPDGGVRVVRGDASVVSGVPRQADPI